MQRDLPERLFRFVLPLLLALACKPDPEAARRDPRVVEALRSEASPQFPSKAILHERGGAGRIAYLGMSASETRPERGKSIELVHFFKVLAPTENAYDVFVHGDLPGAAGRVLVADHGPIFGRLPIHAWREGEIWADAHRVLIPEDVPTDALEIWVGLFARDRRWNVEAPPGASDGRDRVRAARLRLSGAAGGLPEVEVPRAEGAIHADGRLDEPAWAKAPRLTFSDTMGRGGEPRYPTTLALLYDDTNLYVAFESTDEDITERYSKRDDPIYEHETVELFLMPGVRAPDVGPYVELQASPSGVIFDAAFTGRRQGMDTSFDAGQTVGTTIKGTLDEKDHDRGWVSEWVVPFAGIRGVSGAPKPGDEWRMNAFRIEKYRQGDRLAGEYTAWSPPRVGDFHNVARFGRLRFGH